ncbi:tyrosine-protein kinase TXK-like [Saccostrea echinata]|uniref:tyrosine-protein kinase TXK-like n=1 Tax=Saccostrea echinata TaxID=191078 RepID=UPI002A804512|nr:tyrosine-protein kinase TXK-like [Saccostrea echinata]
MPIQWFAPESLAEMNTYSTESDVWSFGVTVWEIFSLGDLPYINYNNMEIIDLLKEGFRLRKPMYADARFYDIMKSCWKMKPANRPTFSSLVIELTNITNLHVETKE